MGVTDEVELPSREEAFEVGAMPCPSIHIRVVPIC